MPVCLCLPLCLSLPACLSVCPFCLSLSVSVCLSLSLRLSLTVLRTMNVARKYTRSTKPARQQVTTNATNHPGHSIFPGDNSNNHINAPTNQIGRWHGYFVLLRPQAGETTPTEFSARIKHVNEDHPVGIDAYFSDNSPCHFHQVTQMYFSMTTDLVLSTSWRRCTFQWQQSLFFSQADTDAHFGDGSPCPIHQLLTQMYVSMITVLAYLTYHKTWLHDVIAWVSERECLSVCVCGGGGGCVRACVRACGRVCVCVCCHDSFAVWPTRRQEICVLLITSLSACSLILCQIHFSRDIQKTKCI